MASRPRRLRRASARARSDTRRPAASAAATLFTAMAGTTSRARAHESPATASPNRSGSEQHQDRPAQDQQGQPAPDGHGHQAQPFVALGVLADGDRRPRHPDAVGQRGDRAEGDLRAAELGDGGQAGDRAGDAEGGLAGAERAQELRGVADAEVGGVPQPAHRATERGEHAELPAAEDEAATAPRRPGQHQGRRGVPAAADDHERGPTTWTVTQTMSLATAVCGRDRVKQAKRQRLWRSSAGSTRA